MGDDPHNFEVVPPSIRRMERTGECLKIRGLRREFGTKIAVDDLSMTMYSG